MIEIQCKHCSQRMRVPRSARGRQCRCPRCNAIVDIDGPRHQAPAALSDTGEAFAELAMDELSIESADDPSAGETDILPAIEPSGAPAGAADNRQSWGKRLKASYSRPVPSARPDRRQMIALIIILCAMLVIIVAAVVLFLAM